jgi:deoxycytidylate deaminase
MSEISYPYLPDGRTIEYVPEGNEFMEAAKRQAIDRSLDKALKTGAVVVAVVDGAETVIGEGANGSAYHETHECERVKQNMPSGQGYELCEGCHPKNHAEPSAIENAKENGYEDKLSGSSLYLWGHWWCCEPCWTAMIEAGVEHVYLLEGSEWMFDRDNPKNVLKTAY